MASMRLRPLFKRFFKPEEALRERYEAFRRLLAQDKKCLELITELEEVRYGRIVVDWSRVRQLVRALVWSATELIRALDDMNPGQYSGLQTRLDALQDELQRQITPRTAPVVGPYVLSLDEAASHPDMAGGKAAHLGQALVALDFPVPAGFLVTANAFNLFVQKNGLRSSINEILSNIRLDHSDHLDEATAQLQELIEDGDVPQPILDGINMWLDRLDDGQSLWAVRSSAIGEDSGVSFAGQYDSVLNVRTEDVIKAWKEVLVSKYSQRAVAYRMRHGMSDISLPMAVLVLKMVPASASGVLYTLDPASGDENPNLGIYAVPGLGEALVGGEATPSTWFMPRSKDYVCMENEQEAGADEPLLSNEELATLTRWGLMLEDVFKSPQDVEWSRDDRGNLFLLQSRPLREPEELHQDISQRPEVPNPVLVDGGQTASHGVASGRIFFPRLGGDARDVPEGAVVVCKSLPPKLVSAVGRLRAVISPEGSRASHFASVAREFGIPVIVGVQAAEVLRSGEEVTVDADRGLVFEGHATELVQQFGQDRQNFETPLTQRMAEFMPLVSKLTLTDPASERFAPEHCASVHDVVRFCHEKGVTEMFSIAGKGMRGLGRARKLESGLPLLLYVMNLAENGGDTKGVITPDELSSVPMLALWQGITHPDIKWSEGLVHVDWEEFDKVSAGILGSDMRSLASHALVSEDYCHVMVRFGYHFCVIDCLCGADPDTNYLAFRFKGGGADFDKRLLRLEFVRDVLTALGFENTSKGDMLDAKLARHEKGDIIQRLTVLGILLGVTRLMDMSMEDTGQAAALARQFVEKYAPWAAESLVIPVR